MNEIKLEDLKKPDTQENVEHNFNLLCQNNEMVFAALTNLHKCYVVAGESLWEAYLSVLKSISLPLYAT